MTAMVRLSVNVNKVALLRNSRGGDMPSVLQAARTSLDAGCHGITVHPRPDARHITYKDVRELDAMLRAEYKTEFNIEGYPTPEFLNLVCEVKPTQVTLVPDPPDALTSDHGWDFSARREFLIAVTTPLHDDGIRVSMFADADPSMIAMAKECGADRVELYTGPYAHAFGTSDFERVLAQHVESAQAAESAGLGINAGHDLNTENLPAYVKNVRGLQEVSIGHALFCDAIYLGLKKTVGLYLKAIAPAPEAKAKSATRRKR
ncbi:MAG TPA: pyridoxine 5'-phosphate synthase [Candidatus Binataceae bacterium]|nr:pyridoxine 5'-phosphate synthase [Candidatus Binataceae bacterium]